MTATRNTLEPLGADAARAAHWNLPVAQLVEQSLCRGEATLTAQGALLASTGKRTGRSPKDKFIVKDATVSDHVEWGAVNAPIGGETFDRLLADMTAYAAGKDLFVTDAWAGADAALRMPIRIITEFAWHALFVRQLFRRPSRDELAKHNPTFTILALPNFKADPTRHAGLRSEAFIIVNFSRRLVIIGGTHYAGEMKKSIFSILNFLLPAEGVFPMHCSANVGPGGDVALFFGLSGTGKTTLSADATRRLIGDDEHGWSDRGVFNFEGGCYAKCIRLSPRGEPEIYRAIRFGAVLENVVVDPLSREPNYDDGSLTENTRAAYPLEFIDNAVPEGLVNAHPRNVVFLTCDAFGVLPPISRLSTQQAMYHFISGYTAKVAGTEAGVGNDPETTFSTCFGAPFLPRPAMVYAKLLAEKVEKHRARCWLLNTGWSGGPFGVGSRMKLDYTRAMLRAALAGQLDDLPAKADPIFGVQVPQGCPNVPAELLMPRATWKSPGDYDAKARDLAGRFVTNFKKFSGVSAEVIAAGPRV